MGWQVLDSVRYELNPVRNELLHLWRAFLACYFLGGNSTVSEIRCALIFEMYALWHMYCSVSDTIYQPYHPCDAHDALLFGLFLITTLVPDTYKGVRL